MFFWNSCIFDDPADVGNLISGSSAFSKTRLNIDKLDFMKIKSFCSMKDTVKKMRRQITD